ncbi:MAG: ATP-binding protein [Ruminococcaceae bacterium]|nr:ATP-binding protein [Oscillospiraceae bacterium]
MLYTEENVRDNLRNRDGKRVFFLGREDKLTSAARDFLTRERIPILPAEQAKIETYRLLNGAYLSEKPEQMTHLNGDILVLKTHPRISFRGAMDTLEAELLLCQLVVDKKTAAAVEEILNYARLMIRCDVLNEPLPSQKLCGLTPEQLRSHSHRPQEYYGQPHFMPQVTDGEEILRLNRCRCAARQAELQAVRAFLDEDGNPTRPDLLQGLNRLSSMLYILMIQCKKDR